MNARPRPWKPIVGIDAAKIIAALDVILARTNDEIMDVFKENNVPVNEWMPRLIQTMLGAAAGATQLQIKATGLLYTRAMWRDFALEVWDGMDAIWAAQEKKDRA